MSTKTEATLEDLYKVDGKAELINGEIVQMPPTGGLPSYAAREITVSLRDYERRTKSGYAVTDNAAFTVNLPHRKSFSPDAAFYAGGEPTMKFFEGAPVFAVEVRSEGDYGPKAEERMTEKRADYFAAGTQVVWDVDLLSETPVRVFRASDPDNPRSYRRGEVAEAEPALPGWTMPVDDLFV
ncbi:MAG: Uma2 family endonuclease [Acidobacteriota bacterium]|nr:Uma2 family endonuclease [Acidobacteriota bacterium]MDQ5837374.1 Uma2 family endonuclease [Acidobacteriota bacterium]